MRSPIILLFLFNLLNSFAFSQSFSFSADQVSAPQILQGSFDNPIIRLRIDVNVASLTLQSLKFASYGTTSNANDISYGKVFSTDSDSVFSNAVQYGGLVVSFNSIYQMNANKSLSLGANYFWFTFSIKPTAPACDLIDAQFLAATISGGIQNINLSPSGNSIISPCPTGINILDESNMPFTITSDPLGDYLNFKFKNFVDYGSISLIDLLGEQVFVTNIKNEQTKNVSIKNVRSGIYVVKLVDGEKYYCKKLIVQRD